MKGWLVGAVAIAIAALPAREAVACSNARGAWFHYHDRPGGELEAFLDGKLGVLEPSYDAVYLFAAYRYLTERPLSPTSQESVASYWTQDPPASGVNGWPGVSPVRHEQTTRDGNTHYFYYLNCNRDAFVTATATRAERSERYGPESVAFQRWLGAQNQVFQNCARDASIPEAPDGDWSALEQADRKYQIAAAHFYRKNFDEAATHFAAIATDRDSPWSDIAAYLVARTFIRIALVGDGPRDTYLDRARSELLRITTDPSREAVHQASRQHLQYIQTLLGPGRRLAEVEDELLGELDRSFPGKWRDYRLLSRTVPNETLGLHDWLWAIRGYPPDSLERAYQRWTENRELAWLVLLLMKATPETPWLDEVLDAAAEVDEDSPAFWTASYYRAKLLLDSNRVDSAREALANVSVEATLSLSDRNRFEGLLSRSASSLQEFLTHAAMTPVLVGFTDGVRIFEGGSDGLSALRDGRRFFETETASIINLSFPPELLAQAARIETLPTHLRRTLALAAFSRAFLSGDEDSALVAAELSTELAPELTPELAEFRGSSPGSEREFTFALASLKLPGLGPNLRGAAERIAPLNRIGAYRILNWWCVANPDAAQPSPDFYTEATDASAREALEVLSQLDPAPIHLGNAVLSWADEHQSDPRVPEALHLVVRSTRYGCEWGPDGKKIDYGDVSKRAFDALHQRYPQSAWTEQTKYWYR